MYTLTEEKMIIKDNVKLENGKLSGYVNISTLGRELKIKYNNLSLTTLRDNVNEINIASRNLMENLDKLSSPIKFSFNGELICTIEGIKDDTDRRILSQFVSFVNG